jgi:poly [ADP-ribose] polymerase
VAGKFYAVDVCPSSTSASGDGLDVFGAAMTLGGSGKLDKAVAAVVKMIFNVETMRNCLVEMSIDATKLPLGSLSRERLLAGCSVLSRIAAVIDEVGDAPKDVSARMKLVDGSNHFFTIVPHSFGTQSVQLIDTAALVCHHMKTMEALLEMETATQLIQRELPSNTDILDSCFAKLQVDMKHIAFDSPTFHTLDTYLQRTLASTHKTKYDLSIIDAFSISRHLESERFEPWLDLHNHQVLARCSACRFCTACSLHRQLLWHGSRVSNFVGILSQGLRIAPKEAPVTGYMFGKVRHLPRCFPEATHTI